MDEKELVETLTKICEYHCGKMGLEDDLARWHMQTASYLKEVIDWHQRRVDIMQVAETPFPEWCPDNQPYVYQLGKFLQNEAHMELDSYIVYGLGDYQLDLVNHNAKLAKEHLQTAFKKMNEDEE